ncbi:hypothetical protein P7K49_010451 [Saguinus oedipus]|uniref:Uncharacterized protein n=1 Tax=Saguinus oedipus TaxID=9490 RepID=A0ABQ9VMT6_SAGOE|nr:hypothetical protein P7K49_010451 [Saguinus oedipus]
MRAPIPFAPLVAFIHPVTSAVSGVFLSSQSACSIPSLPVAIRHVPEGMVLGRMAAARRCLSLLLLSTCVALLLEPLLGAQGAPLEPVYPGDNATPEQMAQYAADLRRYINMLTRPRCVLWSGREISGTWAHPTVLAMPYLQSQPLPGLLLGKQGICAEQTWARVWEKTERGHAGLLRVGLPPCCWPLGAQPYGLVMPPPASDDSMGSASPALPSAPLALAKVCSLLPHRLNKASQSHSLSCVSVDPWWGAAGSTKCKGEKGEGRVEAKGITQKVGGVIRVTQLILSTSYRDNLWPEEGREYSMVFQEACEVAVLSLNLPSSAAADTAPHSPPHGPDENPAPSAPLTSAFLQPGQQKLPHLY